MNRVIKLTLWGKDVAAVTWNTDKEYGVIEFFGSFVKESLNIAPMLMPLGDLQRGERIFLSLRLGGKPLKGCLT